MSENIERVTEAQIRREMLRDYGRQARRRGRIGAAVVLATALLVGYLAARFLFVLVNIRTDAMEGLLHSGDVVLCWRQDSPVFGGDVTYGSPVLVRYSYDGMTHQTVRRVIALGGDEITVEPDGHVAVNGEPIEEPYATYRVDTDWSGEEETPGGALENPFADEEDIPRVETTTEVAPDRVNDLNYPLTVPDGMLFVLCDNREDLMDSRSSRFGMVKQADALALARAVIWPAHRAVELLGVDIQQ